MRISHGTTERCLPNGKSRRRGAAAVEFAACLPLVVVLLLGLWEVGRITEVQQVIWNAAREGGRDASLGQSDLSDVTNNVLLYLQSAEPTAFGKGHAISVISPVIALPPNTTGYTCWDNTANRELFTITYKNNTNPTLTDPTAALQLDRYTIAIEVPYASIGWVPVATITGRTRLFVAVDWVSMRDSPFQITPALPAH